MEYRHALEKGGEGSHLAGKSLTFWPRTVQIENSVEGLHTIWRFFPPPGRKPFGLCWLTCHFELSLRLEFPDLLLDLVGVLISRDGLPNVKNEKQRGFSGGQKKKTNTHIKEAILFYIFDFRFPFCRAAGRPRPRRGGMGRADVPVHRHQLRPQRVGGGE